jgi:hypothetical protein
MPKHSSFSKIGQFRNVVKDVIRQAEFEGLNEAGEAVYNPGKKKPIITFHGSVKLHGTNAGVLHNETDGIWYQSRENIITPVKDNAGFAFFAEGRKEAFLKLIQDIRNTLNLPVNVTIGIFGEWAGKGIQKGVGISEIEKAFFIFAIKIIPVNSEEASYYIPDDDKVFDKLTGLDQHSIYNLQDYSLWSIPIDFNNPEKHQNLLIQITEEVEKLCPVAKEFGITGIGEGVVWEGWYEGTRYIFKVKGELHSVTKVKTLASVDTEKLNSIQEFVNYAATPTRFDQAIQNVFPDGDLDIKKLGDLLKWMIHDITTEEMDTMLRNNLRPADVNKYISGKVKEMFFEKQNNSLIPA